MADRKGHDMRYAIDPTKIYNELGWLKILLAVDFTVLIGYNAIESVFGRFCAGCTIRSSKIYINL